MRTFAPGTGKNGIFDFRPIFVCSQVFQSALSVLSYTVNLRCLCNHRRVLTARPRPFDFPLDLRRTIVDLKHFHQLQAPVADPIDGTGLQIDPSRIRQSQLEECLDGVLPQAPGLSGDFSDSREIIARLNPGHRGRRNPLPAGCIHCRWNQVQPEFGRLSVDNYTDPLQLRAPTQLISRGRQKPVFTLLRGSNPPFIWTQDSSIDTGLDFETGRRFQANRLTGSDDQALNGRSGAQNSRREYEW